MSALVIGASACAVPYDYRAIEPTWAVQNSPIPVPHPKAKPRAVRQSSVQFVNNQRRPVRQSPPRVIRTTAVSKTIARDRRIVVQRGDTLNGLARKNGLSPSALASTNALRAPYTLRVGQVLALPRQPSPNTTRAVYTAAKPSTVRPNKVYTVRRGDGLYAIAKQQGVSAAEIARMNNLRKPYRLAIGQRLKLPDAQSTKLAAPSVRKTRLRSAQAGTATFIWPVAGKIVSPYGAKPNGLTNDGINISAKTGDPIFAAAGGQVIYAGDRIRAFGNLILIRHKSGLVSAYAHIDDILVSDGEWIHQGDQIATVGQSGSVTRPQLHFELRRNSQPIDPMRYLGRTQMVANSR